MNPLLLEVLSVQSHSRECDNMQSFILDHVCKLDDVIVDFDELGNIYITKGESSSYPCIVSHMDTVHKILPDDQYKVIYDDDHAFAYNPILKELTGIGGDDKVGVYICLQMLADLEYCKVAFFVDEEIGCIGSESADMSFFRDVRFVLQCDRKGNSDFVYNILGTDLYDEQFFNDIIDIIPKYGYGEHTGGLTDVYTLAENGVGVAVANMSCGYYNPHSDDEIVCISDVENCREMVYEIMTSCTKVYKYEVVKKSYSTWWKDGGNGPAYYSSNKKNDNEFTKGWTKDDYDDWYGYNDSYVGANDDKWDGWEYKDNKYVKTFGKGYMDCWDCGEYHPTSEINMHGLCRKCTAYHEGIANGSDTRLF